MHLLLSVLHFHRKAAYRKEKLYQTEFKFAASLNTRRHLVELYDRGQAKVASLAAKGASYQRYGASAPLCGPVAACLDPKEVEEWRAR